MKDCKIRTSCLSYCFLICGSEVIASISFNISFKVAKTIVFFQTNVTVIYMLILGARLKFWGEIPTTAFDYIILEKSCTFVGNER